MQKERINVIVTVNSKYMRYLYIMLVSLFENNANDAIVLYVMQKDFTQEDKSIISKLVSDYNQSIEYIDVDISIFDHFPVYKGGWKPLPIEVYFRLVLPELAPKEIAKALLLDVDIVINGSIRELWCIDLDGYVMAMAPNMSTNYTVPTGLGSFYSGRTRVTHYNSGVSLINIEHLRNDYKKWFLLEEAAKMKLEFPTYEQEVFNILFGENLVKEFSALEWNYCVSAIGQFKKPKFREIKDARELKATSSIIHFAGSNPWGVALKNPLYTIWWEWASKTPYYKEILKETYLSVECELQEYRKRIHYIDYIMIDSYKRVIKTNIERLSISKVVLFGAGRIGKCLELVLEELGVEVMGFCDSKGVGTGYVNETTTIDKIDSLYPEATHVIVSTNDLFLQMGDILQSTSKKYIINIDELLELEWNVF